VYTPLLAASREALTRIIIMFTKPEALSIVPRSESPAPFRLPFRARSVVASLGAHVLLILLLRAASSPVPALLSQPEKFRPEDHKIVYYDFRKKLPEVRPDRTVAPAPFRGAQVAKQTIIARSPQPKSKQQMVLLPTPPKLQLQEDVAQRNLIARLRTSLPALPAPPPPKEPPKPDVKQGVKAPTPAVAAEAPRELNRTAEKAPDPVQIPKPVKAFTPPPPSPRTPRLTYQTAVLDAPAPLAAGTPPLPTQLNPGAGFPVLSLPSAPPPSNAPTAAAARDGNAPRDVVIVSLQPSEKAGNELPTGDRPGEFSRAPAVGAPSASGDGKGLTIPNLAVHEEPPKPAKPPVVAPPMRTVVYTELMRNIPISTYSAPLRPGVRSIPRNLEPRFGQRVVYTIAVPIENLPIYGGDWILWFAEREPVPGVTPVMRAPLPFRKQELVDATPPAQRTSQRLQIAGVLEKDGKIGELTLLTQASRDVEQAVLKDLGSWEFKPATRNAAPVGIDVVFEIPFNLPPLKAAN